MALILDFFALNVLGAEVDSLSGETRMAKGVENRLASRGLLLRQELEVVKIAIERSAKLEDASRDEGDWSRKLRRWRDEIEVSLRNLPNRLA